MKRIDQKVPGFDEIIFENRNKSYGAYDLRKKYKLAACFSILVGVTLCSVPLILIFAFSSESVTAKSHPGTSVVVRPDNLIRPDNIVPPEPERPVQVPHQFKYVAPKVVEDTAGLVNLIVTDMAKDSVVNETVIETTDSVTYAVPVMDAIEEEPEPLVFVEEQPFFPGGKAALFKYIAEHTIYPVEALENNIQGKVFVRFVVTSDGSVKRAEILRGLNPALDAEALRVVSSLPAWIPGRQNGKPVPVWFNLPVTFTIFNY